MIDEFYEQLIVKNNKKRKILVYALIGIIGLGLLLYGPLFFGPGILPVIIIVVALVYFFIAKTMNIEYEYSMLNSELQVDVIYNKERRKHLFTVDVRKAEIIAGCDNDRLGSFKVEKVIDVSSDTSDEKEYSIMANINGRLCNVIIEPDDKIKQQLKNWSGSRFVEKNQ